MEPLLELRGVNKSFGVVHVLHDVDFAVYPGQVTALVGDNGAGKSTLVKIIAGIYGRDSGDYHFDGKRVEVHGPRDVAALGVAQTRQVLDLVRRLADRGLGVVLISHNMGDVFEVADRITALYLGRVAADVPAKDVNHSQVVELITAGRSGDLGIAENPATAAV